MWTHDLPGLLTAIERVPGHGMLYLLAEAIPDSGWDWVVWMSGAEIASGFARDDRTAQKQAEQAAQTFIQGDFLHINPMFRDAIVSRPAVSLERRP